MPGCTDQETGVEADVRKQSRAAGVGRAVGGRLGGQTRAAWRREPRTP